MGREERRQGRERRNFFSPRLSSRRKFRRERERGRSNEKSKGGRRGRREEKREEEKRKRERGEEEREKRGERDRGEREASFLFLFENKCSYNGVNLWKIKNILLNMKLSFKSF